MPVEASAANLNSIASAAAEDPCDDCLSDSAQYVFSQVGRETGWLSPSGLESPGVSFNQCMVNDASKFSLGGIYDLITGSQLGERSGIQLAAGNAFTGLYAAFGGSADDALSSAVGAAPGIMRRAMTPGANFTTLRFRGVFEPTVGRSASGGLRSVLGFLEDASPIKDAVDLGLFGAEVLDCSSE